MPAHMWMHTTQSTQLSEAGQMAPPSPRQGDNEGEIKSEDLMKLVE